MRESFAEGRSSVALELIEALNLVQAKRMLTRIAVNNPQAIYNAYASMVNFDEAKKRGKK